MSSSSNTNNNPFQETIKMYNASSKNGADEIQQGDVAQVKPLNLLGEAYLAHRRKVHNDEEADDASVTSSTASVVSTTLVQMKKNAQLLGEIDVGEPDNGEVDLRETDLGETDLGESSKPSHDEQQQQQNDIEQDLSRGDSRPEKVQRDKGESFFQSSSALEKEEMAKFDTADDVLEGETNCHLGDVIVIQNTETTENHALADTAPSGPMIGTEDDGSPIIDSASKGEHNNNQNTSYDEIDREVESVQESLDASLAEFDAIIEEGDESKIFVRKESEHESEKSYSFTYDLEETTEQLPQLLNNASATDGTTTDDDDRECEASDFVITVDHWSSSELDEKRLRQIDNIDVLADVCQSDNEDEVYTHDVNEELLSVDDQSLKENESCVEIPLAGNDDGAEGQLEDDEESALPKKDSNDIPEQESQQPSPEPSIGNHLPSDAGSNPLPKMPLLPGFLSIDEETGGVATIGLLLSNDLSQQEPPRQSSDLVTVSHGSPKFERRIKFQYYILLAVTFAIGASSTAVVVLMMGGLMREEGRGGGEPTLAAPSSNSAASNDSSPFPYAKPSFRYEPFHELEATIRTIANDDLGYYSDILWNTHGLAPIEGVRWRHLASRERRAASLLGYTGDTWDCFIHHYDSYSWEDLPDEAARAYQILGWTRARWEGSSSVATVASAASTESKWWDLLSEDEKTAAHSVCFFRDNWDRIDMNPNPSYFPHPVPTFRYRPWRELGDSTRRVASSAMGYDEVTWNVLGSAASEAGTFSTLDDDQRAGAIDLGFYPHTWDCYANHYLSYHWGSFHGDLKIAVETLGWDEVTWTKGGGDGSVDGDVRDVPASENTSWMDLTDEERGAATRLCYFEEIWDGVSIWEWYDYDACENTAVALNDELPTNVDLHIFDETGYAGGETI